MLKSGRDSRNSRPSSASRVTTGSTGGSNSGQAQPLGPTRSRSGITSSSSNIPGSAENIKALYDRGRSERPQSGSGISKTNKGVGVNNIWLIFRGNFSGTLRVNIGYSWIDAPFQGYS